MSRIRLWLRRVIILLITLLLAPSAGVSLLYYRRDPLPPAPAHARVAPSFTPVRGLSSCWAETGSAFTSYPFAMTGGSIVVKHPAGTLLIDTGNSTHFDEEV